MPRRRGLIVFAVLILATAAAAAWLLVRPRAASPAAGALRGYNVLLVTIDTLRADRVGAYGSTSGLTPSIDRLAREGVRFASARAHVPLTLPSHASLLTARIPPRNGVRDNGTYRLDPGHATIATTLKSAGYRTAAFVGAFVLDARFGLGRAFDLYDDFYGEAGVPGRVEVVERRAEKVTKPAATWIAAADTPWFAWVHLYDPHEPYLPPEPYASRYSSAPYDGEVAYADAVLGTLLDGLARTAHLDRTLVVVTADHGEGLGDHQERTHGLFAYDSTLRVPLVFWCKDRIAPAVANAPVGLVDVAPTILDLLGLTMPDVDGRSARADLTGDGSGPQRPTVGYFEALNASLTRNWAPLTGITSDGLKLIDLPVPELYDLRADPGETTNIYARRTDAARRLERTLDALARPPSAGGGVDPETAARLQSLGYVVGQTRPASRPFTAADDPKNLVALDASMDAAVAAAGRGDHASAITDLRRVIAQRPDLSVAYDRLAFVLRSAGRTNEAIEVVEKAAAAGVADAPLLVTLGTLLQETGRFDRSAQVLEAAVQMNPQDLEARNRLGTTYARMGRADDAERAFRTVLEADPNSGEALTNLGVLYLATGRRDRAIATLRDALAADPGLAGARNTLAVAYARSDDLDAAVTEWRTLLEAQPDNADVLYNLGTALLQLGRAAEAKPYLERFVAVAPPAYAADVARVRQMIASQR
jgi:arylsulfatase A-like enzyme/tetratricopeptide (TPR) repeat protein